MIRHIVLLKVKDINYVPTMFEALKSLQAVIPEIRSFTWGPNNSPEMLNRGYNYGFIMEFNNKADREYYLKHQAHIDVANSDVLPKLYEVTDPTLVFDYEI